MVLTYLTQMYKIYKLYKMSSDDSEIIERISVLVSYCLFIIFFPFSLCTCLMVLMEYERAVVFRLGRVRSGVAKGPGVLFILPCVDNWEIIDLRIETISIYPQEVLSKDSVTVTVDAVIFYYIQEPMWAILRVSDYCYSTTMLGATILRNVLGTQKLKQILIGRKIMADEIFKLLDVGTNPWGVKVERVELQEIRLPLQMQRAMASEAEATREARAKVIAADGELRASQTLKDASDIMTQGSAAVQLRYLQTLNTLSTERNSTILFPIPLNMLPPPQLYRNE